MILDFETVVCSIWDDAPFMYRTIVCSILSNLPLIRRTVHFEQLIRTLEQPHFRRRTQLTDGRSERQHCFWLAMEASAAASKGVFVWAS
jgi:hypothetical protein